MKLEKPEKQRRVLVVDDDSDSVDIISEALSWEGYQIVRASNGVEALERMSSFHPDLILLDVNLPDIGGLDILKSLRSKESYISVMLISGKSSTPDIIKGLDSGADDYIAKPFDPLELLARVRTQLRIKDLNEELLQANLKLKELSNTDDLTGLYNMRSLYQKLEFELERARRFGRQVAVVMMDMDHFKHVNDGHDHLFGSFVLGKVGEIIRNNIRVIDIGARYGGDEFLMALTEIHFDGALHFCERLLQSVHATLFKNGKDEIRLTCSIGFAITPPGMTILSESIDPKELVRLADRALYDAKNAGRNNVKHYEFGMPENKKLPSDPPKIGRSKTKKAS